MSNFADEIEEEAEGPIVGVVIGPFGWGSADDAPGEGYGEESKPIVPADKRGVLLTWDEARPLLAYEYSVGYGAPDCHAVTVWTEDKVLFVVQYDGSTNLYSVPRNPIGHVPEMPGG